MKSLVSTDHNYHTKIEQTKEHKIEGGQSTAVPKINVALKAQVEKILELIRWDAKGEVQCLIKYKGIKKPEWVAVDIIKRQYPLLLIKYYETRVILRTKQCEMVFEPNTTNKSQERKLVVISTNGGKG